jgi:protein-disulfide isomerase
METEIKKEPKLSIPMAIIFAGVLIAGAVYFSSTKLKDTTQINNNEIKVSDITPIGEKDMKLGNPDAKVILVMYADFQCPFCGAIVGTNEALIKSLKERSPDWQPFLPEIVNNYVKKGEVLLVYRDWAFLGTESIRAAEAARCAGDQNKFWEYHDYLYSHQDGENQGNFSDSNLKSFAKILNLNTSDFNKCLDENKHSQVVLDSRVEGEKAGVSGTPKGFILKNGKTVGVIEGAEPLSSVKQKIDAILK